MCVNVEPAPLPYSASATGSKPSAHQADRLQHPVQEMQIVKRKVLVESQREVEVDWGLENPKSEAFRSA